MQRMAEAIQGGTGFYLSLPWETETSSGFHTYSHRELKALRRRNVSLWELYNIVLSGAWVDRYLRKVLANIEAIHLAFFPVCLKIISPSDWASRGSSVRIV